MNAVIATKGQKEDPESLDAEQLAQLKKERD